MSVFYVKVFPLGKGGGVGDVISASNTYMVPVLMWSDAAEEKVS